MLEYVMQLILAVFYLVYVAMALTPMLIVFVLRSDKVDIVAFSFDSWIFAIIVFILAFLLSYSYITFIKKINNDIQPETMECTEIEIAEPRYIPIYIAYFVIALSVPKIENNGWIVFMAVFVLIYFLILKGKFSSFNPYILFCGYNFYEVLIDVNKNQARYKIFLISKQTIKSFKSHNNLIRLNDFTFLDKGEKNE